MMKIDFSQKLKNLDGSVSDEAPALGQIATKALLEMVEGDQRDSGEDKFKRAMLAQKIHGAGEIEMSIEELATIKARVGKLCSPVVVFSAWNALEH